MSTSFAYDAFLSHLPQDAPAMEYLATRLKTDGIRVWYEGWEIKEDEDGATAEEKKEAAMNTSRVMILGLSARTTGANWVFLNPQTLPFRNIQDEDRRFIGLLLDDTRPHYSIDKNSLLDWQAQNRERIYPRILHICRPPVAPPPRTGNFPLKKLIGLGHAYAINAAAFSKDSHRLFTTSRDSTIRIWDTSNRECIRVLSQDKVEYTRLAVSPDARFVVAAANDQRLRLFDVATGKCTYVLEGHTMRVNGVVWSPDGRLVASCSSDKSVRIWDPVKGECLQKIHHMAPVLAIDWSPDGEFLVIGSDDGKLYLYTPTEELRTEFESGTSPIVRVAWSRDGHQILGLAQNHVITWWNRKDSEYTLGADGFGREVTDIAWGHNGESVLTLSATPHSIIQKLHLNDPATGAVQKELNGDILYITAIAICPEGRFVFAGDKQGKGQLWDLTASLHAASLFGHSGTVRCAVLNSDEHLLATGGADLTVRLWDMDTGRPFGAKPDLLHKSFSTGGHRKPITAIGWKPRSNDLVSGSEDGALRLRSADNIGANGSVIKGKPREVVNIFSMQWDRTGSSMLTAAGSGLHLWKMYTLTRSFEGHTGGVYDVRWSPDNLHAVSCSHDKTIRFWEIATGKTVGIGAGHTNAVVSVSWSPNGRHVLSASFDWTIRLWEFPSGRCLHVLEGHREMVNHVCYNHNGQFLASSSYDGSIRFWDIDSGACLHVIRDYVGVPYSLFWSHDGQVLYAQTTSGLLYGWDVSALYRPPADIAGDNGQVRYANAKVLIVGDSGVGKTALAGVLAGQPFGETTSTDGILTRHFPVSDSPVDGAEREILLLDFAGQTDYRLTHQLFMEEAAMVIFLFDPQNRDPFGSLVQWINALQKASRKPFVRLLVAARVDRGITIVPDDHITQFMTRHSFHPPVYLTSARTGAGCPALRDAIIEAIDWEQLPETSSPILFRRLKQEILHLREKGHVLMSMAELKQRMDLALPNETFDLEDLRTVIRLLTGPGYIRQLIGDQILLQPEILSRYAAALIRKVRQCPGDLGFIPEEDLLSGQLDYQDLTRLPPVEESVILWDLYATMIRRDWIIRQSTDKKMLLIFPGYSRRPQPKQKDQQGIAIAYRFQGETDDIFTTLVVRLHHTSFFTIDQLWQDAAGFRTRAGKTLGITLVREPEGTGRLEVWAQPGTDLNSLYVFIRYIYDHLAGKVPGVVRLKQIACTNRNCDEYGRPYSDQARIDKALSPGGSGKVYCIGCGTPIPLLDTLEAEIDSPEIGEAARNEADISINNISNENKESVMVGEVMKIVAGANHLFRRVVEHDKGIDGEIEFNDRDGIPSAQRVYVQLKSGDSHLRELEDGVEVFDIKEARWATYWRNHRYPVLLVIRNSKGTIRYMDISASLHQAAREGKENVRSVIFKGELFDAAALHRLRDKLIAARK